MAFSEALKTKLKRKLSNKSRTTIQLEGYSSITKFQCGISSSEGGGKTLQVQVSTCTGKNTAPDLDQKQDICFSSVKESILTALSNKTHTIKYNGVDSNVTDEAEIMLKS